MSRKRIVWLGVVGLVAAVVAVSLIALPRGPEWTTSSPQALDEFEAALDSMMKLYEADTQRHLERAVELDPDFVVAKLMLADSLRSRDRERSEKLLAEALGADVERLRPRERLLVERARAVHDKKPEEADRLVDEYLVEHPDDPLILNRKADILFARGDLEVAEKLYRRLVEIDPNRVVAYNQLGYITMLVGRFAEAEEYFTSYRFIAPDQANPHDSLGELYLIQGRYDEAETSFERALQIKPDFWASYVHLAVARLLLGDFAGAEKVAARMAAQKDVPKDYLHDLDCTVKACQLERGRQWPDLLMTAKSSGCLEPVSGGVSYAMMAAHRAACELADWKTAAEIEAQVSSACESAKESGANETAARIGLRELLLEGTRLALRGRLAEAEEKLTTAEAELTYLDSNEGVLKLRTRLLLVEIMRAQGRDGDAARMLASVRAVNPVMADEFEEAGSKILGLKS